MDDPSWYGQGNPCSVCRKPISYLGAYVRATRDKPDGVIMCEACARRIDAATMEPWELAQRYGGKCTLCGTDIGESNALYTYIGIVARSDGKEVWACPMCRADAISVIGVKNFDADVLEYAFANAADQENSNVARTPAQTARARRLIDAWFQPRVPQPKPPRTRDPLMSNPRRKTSRSARAEHLRYNPEEPVAPAVVFYAGSHLDHGLLGEHWDFVQELAREHLNGRGLVPMIGTFEMPRNVASLPHGLYGPASGDEPIDDEDVFYESRGGRPWKDRLIVAPKRPSQLMTVIAVPEFRPDHPKGGLVAFTAYGGPMAPQNPDDPGNKDPEGAREFWAEHALAVDDRPMSANRWRSGSQGISRNAGNFISHDVAAERIEAKLDAELAACKKMEHGPARRARLFAALDAHHLALDALDEVRGAQPIKRWP